MYLAGRDEEIQDITNMFEALKANIPIQSVIFSGLRGVGKTVLINKLNEIAEQHGLFCRHIEVEERNDFVAQIATCAQVFLREINSKERFKSLVKKALDAIKSLVVSFDPIILFHYRYKIKNCMCHTI
jgi:Cdc6-like AAA superfamily ATPase